MKILIKQTSKELYSANFEILEDNKLIGNLFLKGHIGSRDADVGGELYNQEVNLKYNSFSKRLYNIIENNNVVGKIYQIKRKTGFLGASYEPKIEYMGNEYFVYPMGLGEKAVRPVYRNGLQIGQIENSGTIYNELYNFDVYCKEKSDLYITVISSIYCYIIGNYRAGEKPIETVKKVYTKTNDKYLLEKYNPDWIKSIN